MDKLEFMAVDVSCLPESLALKLIGYKKAEEQAQSAKRDFEASFIALLEKAGDIPPGMGVAFGYKFGGLAIAFRPLTEKKAPSRPMFVIGAAKSAPTTKGAKWKK